MTQVLVFLASFAVFGWGVLRWRRTGRAGEILTPGIADLRLDDEPKTEP